MILLVPPVSGILWGLKVTSAKYFKLIKKSMGLEPYAITDENNPTEEHNTEMLCLLWY